MFTEPRFPPVGHAYDRAYLLKMKEVAKKHNVDLREGVYCGLGISNCFLLMFLVEISTYLNFFSNVTLGGPCYETIAEINMLRILGGDAVGM